MQIRLISGEEIKLPFISFTLCICLFVTGIDEKVPVQNMLLFILQTYISLIFHRHYKFITRQKIQNKHSACLRDLRFSMSQNFE